MFTGIVEAIGYVEALEKHGGDARVRIASGKMDMSDVRLGDSIAVSGVCLTVVERLPDGFCADVSGETLACTTLGDLGVGGAVNLEKALTPSTRLGGHLVSGHVDGVGEVIRREDAGQSVRFGIKVPDELARYIAEKGSLCIDGISLTVNRVDGAALELNIVPHTLRETTTGGYQSGSRVNVEVDVIARYLERLLLGERAAESHSGITRAFLAEHGFPSE